MRLEDYPILFTDSDFSAIEARKKHFRLLELKLALLLSGAILSVAWASFKSIELGFLMCLSLFLLVALKIWDKKGYPKLWYESRAIAESVKEATWKFAMKAEPYDTIKVEAEKKFLTRLEEIRKFYKDTSSRLQSRINSGIQITQDMHDLRAGNLDQRRKFYSENRIRDQQGWYSKKARWNQKWKERWDALGFIMEISAFIFALALVIGFHEMNIIGILTTATSLVLSWDQSNRHEELHKTYNYTAQSLSLLNARTDLITTESNLSKLIFYAEREISKEHSTWLSRRII